MTALLTANQANLPDTEGKVWVCRPFITLRNGKKLWAHERGKKAFCFWGDADYIPTKKKTNVDALA